MSAREPRKGKSTYQIKNWKEYESGLIQRGNINFWVNNDAKEGWYSNPDIKEPGGQCTYSNLAIQTCLSLRILYNQALRQAEGFVNSLFDIMKIDLKSPDHTTFSRRSSGLKSLHDQIDKVNKDDSITILIDSTGLKIYGSGEWEKVKHGESRRSGWMKLHIGVDEDSKEIVASTLTDHLKSDSSQVRPLLEQVEECINDVKADGAYDYKSVYQTLKILGIEGEGIFPPQKGAVLSKDWKDNLSQRDRNIFRIHMDGRELWEYASGYSKRNLVENAMFRYKNNIGSKLRSRTTKNQESETKLGVHLLNQMTRLGMPDSKRR
jgi:hypothetical protein